MSPIKIHSITSDDSWEILWKAWDLARVNYRLTLTLVSLFFIGAFLSSIPLLGPFISGLVTTLAPLVFLKASSYWEKGEKSNFYQVMGVFKEEDRFQALLPLLVIQFCLAASPAIIGLVPFLGFLIGLMTLITVPLSIIVTIAIPIVFFNFKSLNYKKALSLSVEGISQNILPLLVLVFLIMVLGALSLLALVIGVFLVAMPVYLTTNYLWYRAVYEGLQFEKGKEKSLF